MRTIELTRGKFAKVDDADYEYLNQWKWRHNEGYATRTLLPGRRHINMHRILMGLSLGDGKEVDHINGDGLDNRRCNLRLCTRSQNNFNQGIRRTVAKTSKYRGVSWDTNRCKWRVHLQAYGKQVHVGRFGTEDEAATAWNKVAVEQYGEFARLNIIDKQEVLICV